MSHSIKTYNIAEIKELIQSSSWRELPPLLSRPQACKMLGISRTTFDTLNAIGLFKAAEVGSGRARQYVRERLLMCYMNRK